jgi:hypothetical protein
MPQEELPETKYERLQKRLQEEILNNYPNPERKGCPGKTVLEALAGLPFETPIEGDPNWKHVTHCSECYREFLALRGTADRRNSVRDGALKWGMAGMAVVLVLVMFFFGRNWIEGKSKRPQNAELAAYRPVIIDIDSMTRSATGGGEKKPFFLDREREDLKVRLPVGSKPGNYELRLRNKTGQTVLTRVEAAAINQGVTSFAVRADLSSLTPGQYEMDVRQVGWDWNYFPVVVR